MAEFVCYSRNDGEAVDSIVTELDGLAHRSDCRIPLPTKIPIAPTKIRTPTNSLTEEVANSIALATVKLPDISGQGVLVEGNMIFTAAHCINFSCEGGLVLGDWKVVSVETPLGSIRTAPIAIEPINDIAALGPMDNQEFSADADSFEAFCEQTRAVPICRREPKIFAPFPVMIRTHTSDWISGTAELCRDGAPVLFVDADEQVLGGTSGGPIINCSGELVGIVSNFSEACPECTGSSPRPHLALPAWLLGSH